MDKINKIYNGIDKIIDKLGKVLSYSVLAIMIVIICEVVSRRIFNSPTIWAYDAICMIFGCYIILTCAFGFQKGAFVAVDVLFARLKPINQHLLHMVTYLVFFVPFIFGLMPKSVVFFIKSWVSQEKAYSVWAPPIWPVKLCFMVGLILLALQGVSVILRHLEWVIKYYKNGKKEPVEIKEV